MTGATHGISRCFLGYFVVIPAHKRGKVLAELFPFGERTHS